MKQVRTYYEEGNPRNGVMGFYVTGTKDKDKATEALKHYIENDSEDFLENWEDSNGEPFVFDKDNVKADRYYTCKRTGMQTIGGDGDCVECGFDHFFKSSGRLVFIYPVK